MDYILELKNVSKKYDGFALSDINIALPKGCIMGLIGENGAGKSTTIKMILDAINKDGGSISIFGQDNRDMPKRMWEDIGVVLDESCFPENLSMKEINTIMKNVYKQWDADLFRKYVNYFDLPEKKAMKDYSRGMKMKLGIAVALSHNAKLLILDEATSGLDPVVRDEMVEVFMDFIQDEEHSILMSSHITSDLEKACDYITFIHQGKILFSQGKDELLDKYGILKCAEEELRVIDEAAIVGVRKHKFGVDALVIRDKVRGNFIMDRADIEDIMLFQIKKDQSKEQ